MTCPDNSSIEGYLLRKLPEDERASFDEHLDGCEDCRMLVSELARLTHEDAVRGDNEPVDAAQAVPGDAIVADRYRIVGTLGRGGMGVVFDAVHLVLGTPVALKLPVGERAADLGASGRFLREARIAATLSSRYVARVVDAGLGGGGIPFLAMERLIGTPLDRLAAAEAPLAIERAVDFAIDTALGLADAHAAGIVHRDVKPSNIFVVPSGDTEVAKLIDFGVAKLRTARPDATVSSTITHAIVGTPRYMPPEQLRGAQYTDHRSDLWSLGATLYELLTGKAPFEAASLPELCVAILTTRPVEPRTRRREVPTALAAAIRRLMHVNPENRPKSARAAAELLLPFASARRRRTALAEDGLKMPGIVRRVRLAGARPAIALGLILASISGVILARSRGSRTYSEPVSSVALSPSELRVTGEVTEAPRPIQTTPPSAAPVDKARGAPSVAAFPAFVRPAAAVTSAPVTRPKDPNGITDFN